MGSSIFFKTIVNGMSMLKAKLLNKGINCIDFLANGIDIGSLSSTCNSQRNTWESSTGTHIKQSTFRSFINIGQQNK